MVKSIFRVLTLNLGRANIPLLVTNHTYEVVGAYVPMKEMSGGTGLKYAASNIIFLSKAKEKDGTEVVGNIITATNRKSRFTKENSKVKTRLFYDERGLDRYFGLLELGEQYGVFERVGNRYKVGDKSVYPKQILADPEKYFTEDVMQTLDEEMQQRSSSTVMNERIERTILRNLFRNEEFYRKVLPFIKSDYYEELNEKVIFEEIRKFADKYDRLPTEEVVLIEIERRTDVSDQTFGEVRSICQSFTDVKEDPTKEWLTDATEKWCKDRAIYLALMESIRLADGDDKDEKKSRDSIPDILKEALMVSFDDHIGHDYLTDYKERFDFYTTEEEKIPYDLEFFNKITKGGIPNKTLNVALAGTGVGKSMFMCHQAASCLSMGKNVLYITCEMSEEKIAERIDANLLNVNIKDIPELPRMIFESKVADLARKTEGKLIIKEYPTASAHAGHFRALLNDLALKKSFSPDIIFIDYLNICASSRYKGAIVNSYTYVKAIAEELRGPAVEFDLPIVSATQTTRSGFGNSDVDLTDTSESFGLPATADFMFALISTEELEQQNQIMVKQLKNRYNDLTSYRRFVVGVDRAKMKLYDVEQTEDAEATAKQMDFQPDFSKESQSKFSDFVV